MTVLYEERDGYMHVTILGPFAQERLQSVLPEWIAEITRRGHQNALLDMTGVAGMDRNEGGTLRRFQTSMTIANAMPPELRLALLETPWQIDPDRFGERVMMNRGARVLVTSDHNEAVAWLRADPQDH